MIWVFWRWSIESRAYGDGGRIGRAFTVFLVVNTRDAARNCGKEEAVMGGDLSTVSLV